MNNKDLQKLQKQWYAKLKKSGFQDIEYDDGSIMSGVPRSTKYKDPIQRELTEAYYAMCQKFLAEYKFESNYDRIIWEYHTEGISLRNISKLLKKMRMRNSARSTVWKRITFLQVTMKGTYLK